MWQLVFGLNFKTILSQRYCTHILWKYNIQRYYIHTHLVLLYSNIKILSIIWQTLQLHSTLNKSTWSPLTIFSEVCMPSKEHHLSITLQACLIWAISLYMKQRLLYKRQLTLDPVLRTCTNRNLRGSLLTPKIESNMWPHLILKPVGRSRCEQNTNVRPYLSFISNGFQKPNSWSFLRLENNDV